MTTQIPHPEDDIEWCFGKKAIHPAIDYVDGVVYLSQWLPGKDNSIKPCIITSEPEFYIVNESELPFILSMQPQRIKQRFSSAAIKQYLEGTAPFVSIADVFYKFRKDEEFFMDYQRQEDYDLNALWDEGTYFCQQFNAFPEDYKNAIKRAGKTKNLSIKLQRDFNAKLILDPSASSMFRLSNDNRCTILIDEITHMHQKTEQNLKQMIRGKFGKGYTIPRSEESGRKGKFNVVEYELYSPLSMANIKGIESDIEDRVIRQTLQRTTDKIKGNREVEPLDVRWQEARDIAYLCLLQNAWVVQEYIELFDRTMTGTLSDESLVEVERGRYLIKKEVADYNVVEYKQTDITEKSIYLPLPSTTLMSRDLLAWKPILVLARLVSEDLFKNMLKFAEEKCTKKAGEDVAEDFDVQVVKALLELTTKPKLEELRVRVEVDRGYFPVIKITDHLKERYFPGADWVDSQTVGYALKRIDIHDEKRTVHGRREVLLNFKKLEVYALSIPLNPDEIRSEYLKELPQKLEVDEVTP